jgi:hypothetical protein
MPRRYTFRLLVGAIITTYLWLGASLSAQAQQEARTGPKETHASNGGVLQTLAGAHSRLRLTSMERVGPRAAESPFGSAEPISDREQLAFADASNALLDRLTRSGTRYRGLVRTARFAMRVANAPNQALCRLTGADRARLDLRKRRVSFTWFVSW